MEVKVWRLVWRGVQIHMLHTITKQYGGWYGTSILEPEQALRQLHLGNLGSVERLSVVDIVISVSYPFVK
jgi:hypothetical protein